MTNADKMLEEYKAEEFWKKQDVIDALNKKVEQLEKEHKFPYTSAIIKDIIEELDSVSTYDKYSVTRS